MIRTLVTGCRGQVGSELVRELEGRAEVLAHDRASMDLANPAAIVERIRAQRPQLILNAGAYTAVDRAESDYEGALAVNGVAPGILAEEARRLGALLVHYSTDYVFDGTKPAPYAEDDPPNPLNAYGRSKLEGERAVAAAGGAHVILRTSWVYAPHGRNFLLTMLRLARTEREIRVVDDQHGAPTSGRQLARATIDLLAAGDRSRPLTAADLARVGGASGLYHASAAGETTWFGFAQAIFDLYGRRPGYAFTRPTLVAITAADYKTPARRPANSVLSNERIAATFGVRIPDWRQGLEEAMSALGGG